MDDGLDKALDSLASHGLADNDAEDVDVLEVGGKRVVLRNREESGKGWRDKNNEATTHWGQSSPPS